VTHDSTDEFITSISQFSRNDDRSSWFFIVPFPSPVWLLMDLKSIIIFLKYCNWPEEALFFDWSKVIINIVACLFHQAKVSLWKIFDIIFEKYEENSIVIHNFISQKLSFLLIWDYIWPKFSIVLISFTRPLSIAPWISQLQYFDHFSLLIFQFSCVDLW